VPKRPRLANGTMTTPNPRLEKQPDEADLSSTSKVMNRCREGTTFRKALIKVFYKVAASRC